MHSFRISASEQSAPSQCLSTEFKERSIDDRRDIGADTLAKTWLTYGPIWYCLLGFFLVVMSQELWSLVRHPVHAIAAQWPYW